MILALLLACNRPPTHGCQEAAEFARDLGKTHLLLGASMTDETAQAAPFDLRYIYLAGGLPTGGPCTSCANQCSLHDQSCAQGGCQWWGCWQWDALPPGQYVKDFLDKTKQDRQIPMLVWYQLLHTLQVREGTELVAAVQDVGKMRDYLAHWRFLLETLGNSDVLLHIEPDFWGFAAQQNADPHQIPAAVASASADCSGQENSIAGLSRCMIQMAHHYAPRARVGLHASAWGAGGDVFHSQDPSLDIQAHAQRTAAFMTALGAQEGEFIVVDPADRDAGWSGSQGEDRWWKDGGARPNLQDALQWSHALSTATGCSTLWWQLPLGNTDLDDTPEHWRDNHLQQIFAALNEVAQAQVVGLAFGAGAPGQTRPETDGGHLIKEVNRTARQGGIPLRHAH